MFLKCIICNRAKVSSRCSRAALSATGSSEWIAEVIFFSFLYDRATWNMVVVVHVDGFCQPSLATGHMWGNRTQVQMLALWAQVRSPVPTCGFSSSAVCVSITSDQAPEIVEDMFLMLVTFPEVPRSLIECAWFLNVTGLDEQSSRKFHAVSFAHEDHMHRICVDQTRD